ncbi:MAG TPA: hypothetical protein VFL47_09305, partial [Flavisolibacter sp.]|nr:hypothetical protein [Flavisolibacter sp.]
LQKSLYKFFIHSPETLIQTFTKMKRIILAASVLALTFTACKKETSSNPSNPSNPDTPTRLLKKLTETENGQTTVYNFTYDAAKRLTAIKTTDNRNTINFTYDANGNVVKMEQQEDNDFKNVFTFAYNNGIPASGTFKQWELTAGEPDNLVEDDVLTYTVSNNLVTKIGVNMTLADEAIDFDLTYVNGNLSKVKANGLQGFEYSSTFTYGEKKSPFPKVFNYVMDHAGLSVQFFTKNDIRSIVYKIPGMSDTNITTTYTYDSAGFPLTSTDGSTTTQYEYQ